MTHEQAEGALRQGHKVANVNYSPDEFVFLNADNRLETEEGHIHGTFQDEFWRVYQAALSGNWFIKS